MAIFLRMKHWQLFLLYFGIPFVVQLVFMFSLFTELMHNPNPLIMMGYLKFFPVMMVLFVGTLFGWFWAVATGLQKLMPAGVKMKLTMFKVFFFIPLVYILLISTVVAFVFTGNMANISNEPAPFFIGFAIIFPIHLFSMFCIFYCLYFVAKTIKTVELQREVTFSDFAAEFFLTWFFFIGVWILQPRINKMVSREDDTTITPDLNGELN
jgi:hypothetical protein